jgi:hypothetical protein
LVSPGVARLVLPDTNAVRRRATRNLRIYSFYCLI